MRKTSKAIAALASLLLLGVSGCGSTTSQAPSSNSGGGSSTKASAPVKGGTLTVAFSAEPDTLNPAQTGLTAVAQIDRNVFDTLVWMTPDGKLHPDLATSWTPSNGGKTYTFQLRQGVKFQDGTPFNAQAAAYNFNYIENPSTHSISAIGSLGPFESVKATGPYTLVINLKKPYGPFLSNLADPTLGMQSPTALKKWGKESGLHPIGTGPFKVENFTPNSKVVLVRNPDYNWAPKAETPHGAAYLSKIVFDIVQSGQSRVDELKSGQAQLVDQTPPLAYKSFKSNPKYNEVSVPIPGAGEYAVINNSKWPTNQVAVRKAILYSINRKGLNQLADQGVFPVIWGPLQPGTLGYDPEFKGMYSYNPSKAASILQNAGWKKVNGIWTKDGKQLSLVITHINVGDIPLEAQGIQSYLEKAGMKVSIKEYADSAWHAANVKGVENITPLEFSNLDPDLLRIEFTPGQYFNWSKYNNPKVTSLLEKGLSETNQQQRLQTYFQAEKLLMQDAAMIPEHQNDDLITTTSSVKGETVYPGGDLNYYSAYITK